MTIQALRPNSNVATGGTPTGGAIWEVLSDDDDATYVTLDEGEEFTVGLDALSLPTDAIIQSANIRVRCRREGTPGPFAVSPYLDSSLLYTTSNATRSWTPTTRVTWGSYQTASLGVRGSWELGIGLTPGGFDLLDDLSFEDAHLDGATLELGNRTLANSVMAEMRLTEAAVNVTYVTKPVVGVGLPTGTVTEDKAPAVVWLQALDSAQPTSSHFQVKVITEDMATGFDPDDDPALVGSGVVEAVNTTSGAWPVGEPLPDDDYRAYVRVAVTVNGERLWSDWDYEAFTMDTPEPAAPTLTVVADPDEGRMLITLEANSGDTTTDLFAIQRSDDGEATWEPVRTSADYSLIANTGDPITWPDYEAPEGREVTYRAWAIHLFTTGTSQSGFAMSIGQWSSESWWLKHPVLPDLNFEAGGDAAAFMSFPGTARESRTGIFQPLGAEHAVAITDTRGPRTGAFSIRIDDYTAKARLDALLDTVSPLLLQGPADHFEEDIWIAVNSHDRQRLLDKGWFEMTSETISFTEIGRPSTTFEPIELPEPPPAPEPPPEAAVAFDANQLVVAQTTGTMSGEYTPASAIDGVVVAVIVDDTDATADPINPPTVEGEECDLVSGPATTTGVPPEGWSAIYALMDVPPTGALTIEATKAGGDTSPARLVAYGLIANGEGVEVDASNSLVQMNSATASFNLVTTVDDTAVVAVSWTSPNDVALVDMGAAYTEDLENDFGVNTGTWAHRDGPAASTFAVDQTGPDANCDYAMCAVAFRSAGSGASPPPPDDESIVAQDLAIADDPCPHGVAPNRGWRQVSTAFSPETATNNWIAGDLQIVRLDTDPDPHLAVGASVETPEYRRYTLSECYLAGSLASGATPTTLAVTAVADFPIPTAATASVAGTRAFRYTGRTGSFPNYTLTGVTWIDTTGAYAASTRVPIQSIYDSGVPNGSYRCQSQRWSASDSFYTFQPGMRRQIIWSCKIDPDNFFSTEGAANSFRRDQLLQMKPTPSGGIGPIITVRNQGQDSTGEPNLIEVRHDTTGTSSTLIPEFEVEIGVWIRFMLDITFGDSAATGRLQLFGDVDGSTTEVEELVELSEQFALKTCGAESDSYGPPVGLGIGPYCQMTTPAHWREYANVQVIDPTA